MREKSAHQQRVEKFMALANQEVPSRPTMPDEKTRRFRAKIILEEALETIKGLGFSVDYCVDDYPPLTSRTWSKSSTAVPT
jgi:hypothetical protein